MNTKQKLIAKQEAEAFELAVLKKMVRLVVRVILNNFCRDFDCQKCPFDKNFDQCMSEGIELARLQAEEVVRANR
ncbi:MAG: hypothetical protein V3U75_12775 [Methylococcaceae bacterium]